MEQGAGREEGGCAWGKDGGAEIARKAGFQSEKYGDPQCRENLLGRLFFVRFCPLTCHSRALMRVTVKDILEIVGGKLLSGSESTAIEGFANLR